MSSNWWADKLGPARPAPSGLPPRPVPSAVPVAIPPPVNLPGASPQQYVGVQETPGQYQPTKTTYQRSEGICPECQSGNYFKPSDPRSSSGYRCYDCGYPVVQSTSNMPSTPAAPGEVVHRARQTSTANNYNPKIIVDRIG
jgi:hypothetical protein